MIAKVATLKRTSDSNLRRPSSRPHDNELQEDNAHPREVLPGSASMRRDNTDPKYSRHHSRERSERASSPRMSSDKVGDAAPRKSEKDRSHGRTREERYYQDSRPYHSSTIKERDNSKKDVVTNKSSRELTKSKNREPPNGRSSSRDSTRSRHSDRTRDDMSNRRHSQESRPGGHASSHPGRSNRSLPPVQNSSSHGGLSPNNSSHPQNSRSPSVSIPSGPASQSNRSSRAPVTNSSNNNGPHVRGGKGHFTNLSWTPSDGQKGGNHIQPGERSRHNSSISTPNKPGGGDTDMENNESRATVSRSDGISISRKLQIEPSSVVIAPDMDDIPPPRSSRQSTNVTEQPKSKISFSIKGRTTQPGSGPEKGVIHSKVETSPILSKRLPVTVSPLAQNTIPKSRSYVGNTRVTESVVLRPSPPPTRKEIVKKKRLKPRPQLSEEHAQSDSVYYRKTGNESVVGSGTYGKVYKAVHVYTKREVALKKIRMEGERDGFPVTATREIKLLQSLIHVNVVDLQEVMVEKNDCFMVFEYLAHDLTGLLNHPSFTLTDAHKKHLAKQMFEGLEYLHRKGVLHRDIKAANILISKTGVLKFADFGLARFYQKHKKQDYTNRVITIWYRSPELLLGETQYGPAVDIWSAACVLVEIFTRHAIFPGDGGEINQLDKIYNVLGTPSRNEWPGIRELAWYELLRPVQRIPSTFAEKYKERVSPDAFELLQAMFMYDPSNRPTAADVLEHPYFTTEEPKPQPVVELEELDGDWHEFESKALRKEKERQERDARRREREGGEKRKAEEAGMASTSVDAKKPKTEAVPA